MANEGIKARVADRSCGQEWRHRSAHRCRAGQDRVRPAPQGHGQGWLNGQWPAPRRRQQSVGIDAKIAEAPEVNVGDCTVSATTAGLPRLPYGDEAIPRNAECPVSGRFRLFCRSALRPDEASEAAVCCVRFTSARVVGGAAPSATNIRPVPWIARARLCGPALGRGLRSDCFAAQLRVLLFTIAAGNSQSAPADHSVGTGNGSRF